jgi:hypothetical protein
VIYPRISPDEKKDNELTNGHTHFVLIGEQDTATEKGADATKKPKKLCWGDETSIKFDIAKRIAQGRAKMGGGQPCKIVTVLVGDNPKCD